MSFDPHSPQHPIQDEAPTLERFVLHEVIMEKLDARLTVVEEKLDIVIELVTHLAKNSHVHQPAKARR